jgi:hypothetical protein
MNEIRVANYMKKLKEITDQRPLDYENGEISWLMPNDAGGYGMEGYGPHITPNIEAMLAGFETLLDYQAYCWHKSTADKPVRRRAVTMKSLARRRRRR